MIALAHFQQSSNLIEINNAGNAIMRVDTTPQVTGNRNSVRIQTQYTFTGGLLIMDSVHMPTGCGTWPAFWTNGPNWPTTGEIDIVEGVNNYTNNQATVHTGTGCDLPTSNAAALGISGSVVGGTNCAALQTGNEGCGVRASQTNSFGAAFNNAGGGVFASALSTMLFAPNLGTLTLSLNSAVGQFGYRRLVLLSQQYPAGHHERYTQGHHLGLSQRVLACYELQSVPVFHES
jgi:Glycosyl hydrolases family 16